jgi:hypothetical protein
MGKLDKINDNLEKQVINLLGNLNYMNERQSELEDSLIEKLDNIDNNLENKKSTCWRKWIIWTRYNQY